MLHRCPKCAREFPNGRGFNGHVSACKGDPPPAQEDDTVTFRSKPKKLETVDPLTYIDGLDLKARYAEIVELETRAARLKKVYDLVEASRAVKEPREAEAS